jgi:uncharacterized protein YjbI with pentapeptide repeats
MPQCKHYKICRRDAEENSEEGLCILHSQDPEKNKGEFDKALAAHLDGDNGHNFKCFVFPGPANYFKGATFTEWTSFFGASFNEGADFTGAKFENRADFSGAAFAECANFSDTSFCKKVGFIDVCFAAKADFSDVAFAETVYFLRTLFLEHADFSSATFTMGAQFLGTSFKRADFSHATFTQGAEFVDVLFTENANFLRTKFQGRTFFEAIVGLRNTPRIFSGIEVDFRRVSVEPLDALIFRNADLQKCRFLYTDLRKAEFTNVKWPKIGGRDSLCDQDEALYKGKVPWSLIEQLYRQLKQNYEDRRDYEQARDFHYGEKEMRRKNPDNSLRLRLLLQLYRCVSGYGERSLRPLFSAVILLAATTAAYIWGGLLLPNKDIIPVPNSTSIMDVGLYGLRVMTLLKPNDFVPIGFCGSFVNMIQSIFGPLLFALFALALRQRLKR